MTGAATILLVEDNPGDARLVVELLREAGAEFRVERAERLGPALHRLTEGTVDAVLLDLELPDSRGLETFQRARRHAPNEPIVILTGNGDERLALEAVRAGAQDYLVKGRIDGEILARVLRYAIKRKRAEARLAAIVRAALDAHVLFDAEGTIASWNPQAEAIFGWTAEEVSGRLVSEVIAPALGEANREALRAFIDRGTASFVNRRLEGTAVRKDGTRIPIEFAVTPIRVGHEWSFSTFLRDLTQWKELQQQLVLSQRLEAVGRLAGGVAHDFNNVLTAIFGYVELMRDELPPDSPARPDLEEVRKAAERAAGLTRQLLAFSRQQILDPVVLHPNDLIVDIDKMLQRLVGEDIELRFTLAPDAGNVRADPGQLQQVLFNLAVNARDAMPRGGTLIIETANAELTEQYAEMHQPVVPGRYVMFAVSDTGTGMPPEVRARVFEPFFTTKPKGKGTGLGLSTVYGIVKQSGGYIWVYSEVGHGTTVKIYLPRVDAPAEEQVPPPEMATLSGSETILLAEDDDIVRPLARNLLRKLGYTVLEAADAEQAVAVAAAHHGPLHLLVADVVMPGQSGRELARRLAAAHPSLRVLYCSGYTDDAIVQHGILEPGLHFLQKPFTPEALARRVREVLDGG